MDPTGGWVRLHRKFMQNPIWTQLAPAVSKVAIYFILKANYKPTEWYDGSDVLQIQAGSFVTSYASTATACNISVQQARDAFAHLARTRFATYRRTHRWTLVTVVEYETYQPRPSDENTPENTLQTGQRTTDKEIKKRTNTRASPDGNARDGSCGSTAQPSTEARHRFRSQELTGDQEEWFSQWWSEYWLRKAKKPARKAFGKHVRTEARFQQIMAATRAQHREMLTRETRHRPHAATWLNNERWEDEAEAPPATAQDDYPEFPE